MSNSTQADHYAPLFALAGTHLLIHGTTLLSMTLGNGLLFLMVQCFNRESNFVLLDRMVVDIARLGMVSSVGCLVKSLRALSGPLPFWICSLDSVLTLVTSFAFLLIMDLFMILRLLYATVWRNVGMLNDNFFSFFFRVLIAFYSFLFIGVLKLFDAHRTLEHSICTGKRFVRPQVLGTDIILGFLITSLAIWIGVTVKLLRKWSELNRIHTTTRDRRGLPRAGGPTHPALKYAKWLVLVLGLFMLPMVFPILAMKIWLSQMDPVLKGSLHLLAKTIKSGAMSFFIPISGIMFSARFRDFVRRWLRTVFDRRPLVQVQN